MNKIFRRSLLSLTAASAMVSGVYAGDAKYIDVKYNYLSEKGIATLGSAKDAGKVEILITLLDGEGEYATKDKDGKPLGNIGLYKDNTKLTNATQFGNSSFGAKIVLNGNDGVPNQLKRELKESKNLYRVVVSYEDYIAKSFTETLEIRAGGLKRSITIDLKSPSAKGLILRASPASVLKNKNTDVTAANGADRIYNAKVSDLKVEGDVDLDTQSKKAPGGVAGTKIPIKVYAITKDQIGSGDSEAKFTSAPNLEGKTIVVTAVGDYTNSGTPGTILNSVEITMSNGVAEGEITLKHGLPVTSHSAYGQDSALTIPKGMGITFLAYVKDDLEVSNVGDDDLKIPDDETTAATAIGTFDAAINPDASTSALNLTDFVQIKSGDPVAIKIGHIDATANIADDLWTETSKTKYFVDVRNSDSGLALPSRLSTVDDKEAIKKLIYFTAVDSLGNPASVVTIGSDVNSTVGVPASLDNLDLSKVIFSGDDVENNSSKFQVSVANDFNLTFDGKGYGTEATKAIGSAAGSTDGNTTAVIEIDTTYADGTNRFTDSRNKEVFKSGAETLTVAYQKGVLSSTDPIDVNLFSYSLIENKVSGSKLPDAIRDTTTKTALTITDAGILVGKTYRESPTNAAEEVTVEIEVVEHNADVYILEYNSTANGGAMDTATPKYVRLFHELGSDDPKKALNKTYPALAEELNETNNNLWPEGEHDFNNSVLRTLFASNPNGLVDSINDGNISGQKVGMLQLQITGEDPKDSTRDLSNLKMEIVSDYYENNGSLFQESPFSSALATDFSTSTYDSSKGYEVNATGNGDLTFYINAGATRDEIGAVSFKQEELNISGKASNISGGTATITFKAYQGKRIPAYVNVTTKDADRNAPITNNDAMKVGSTIDLKFSGEAVSAGDEVKVTFKNRLVTNSTSNFTGTTGQVGLASEPFKTTLDNTITTKLTGDKTVSIRLYDVNGTTNDPTSADEGVSGSMEYNITSITLNGMKVVWQDMADNSDTADVYEFSEQTFGNGVWVKALGAEDVASIKIYSLTTGHDSGGDGSEDRKQDKFPAITDSVEETFGSAAVKAPTVETNTYYHIFENGSASSTSQGVVALDKWGNVINLRSKDMSRNFTFSATDGIDMRIDGTSQGYIYFKPEAAGTTQVLTIAANDKPDVKATVTFSSIKIAKQDTKFEITEQFPSTGKLENSEIIIKVIGDGRNKDRKNTKVTVSNDNKDAKVSLINVNAKDGRLFRSLIGSNGGTTTEVISKEGNYYLLSTDKPGKVTVTATSVIPRKDTVDQKEDVTVTGSADFEFIALDLEKPYANASDVTVGSGSISVKITDDNLDDKATTIVIKNVDGKEVAQAEYKGSNLYTATDLPKGTYSVVINAFDKMGNKQAQEFVREVTEGAVALTPAQKAETALAGQSYEIEATIYPHDLEGKDTYLDWVYVKESDKTKAYELKGQTATEADPFGLKEVEGVDVSTLGKDNSWYIVKLTGELAGKFGWAVVKYDWSVAKKLEGVKADGSFEYTPGLNLTAKKTDDGKIEFTAK